MSTPFTSKILSLSATGSLESHVVQEAVSANRNVSILIRTPSKLPPHIQKNVGGIVPYSEAAARMLANMTPNDEMSHHRMRMACAVDIGE